MRPQAGDARSLGKDGLRMKSDDLAAAAAAVRADPRAITPRHILLYCTKYGVRPYMYSHMEKQHRGWK